MKSDGVLEGLRENKHSDNHIEAVGLGGAQVLRDQFLENPPTRRPKSTDNSAQAKLSEAMRRVLGLNDVPFRNPYEFSTSASTNHHPEQKK